MIDMRKYLPALVIFVGGLLAALGIQSATATGEPPQECPQAIGGFQLAGTGGHDCEPTPEPTEPTPTETTPAPEPSEPEPTKPPADDDDDDDGHDEKQRPHESWDQTPRETPPLANTGA